MDVLSQADRKSIETVHSRRAGGPQAGRRARSRTALLASAARGLSRYGYGNLTLEAVSREAGYTRGALYHQFCGKQELTLAVIEWLMNSWDQEVLPQVEAESEPVAALLTLARGHSVFCRRGTARIGVSLRLEFTGRDHPVGRTVESAYAELVVLCQGLIAAGRRQGTIPPGPPDTTVAHAFVVALEGSVIALADHAPHDELVAVRTAVGVLGLDPHTEYLGKAGDYAAHRG